MQCYTREELVSIQEIANSLDHYLDRLTDHTLQRVVIISDDKPQAVLIPIEEYEILKNFREKISEEIL